MKHIKTKYIAVIDLRNSFGSTAQVDVTRSYNPEKVKNSPLLVCYYKEGDGLLKTNSSCYLFYNEEGYSKETLFATGYYLVKQIKEVVVYEDEKTIFEQVDE